MQKSALSELPRRVLIAALVSELALAVLHAVFTWPGRGHYPIAVWRLFHLDHEANLPTWFSAMQLAALGLVCACIFFLTRKRGASIWALFAAGAVFLSADEAASIHERLGHAFSGVLEDAAPGSLLHILGHYESYTWALLYAPVAIPLALFVVYHAWQALPAQRWHIAAGVGMFLAGAVVLDSIEGRFGTSDHTGLPFTLQGRTMHFDIFLVEELLEMAGVTVVLYAFLRHACTLAQAVLQPAMAADDVGGDEATLQAPAVDEPTVDKLAPLPENLLAFAAAVPAGAASVPSWNSPSARPPDADQPKTGGATSCGGPESRERT